MVTASEAAPKPFPKPENWHGVGEGLAQAARLLDEGRHADACELLREILEFAPVEAKAWHMLGLALQRLDEHDEALRCFQTASSCYEGHSRRAVAPSSLRLARMLWQRGERTEAREMLQRLLAEKPEDPELQELQHAWQHDG